MNNNNKEKESTNSKMNVVTKQKIHKQQVKRYREQLTKFILTTRFNNETWEQNVEYRKQKQLKGCIYSSPDSITVKINPEQIVFILEMNNDENKIMGIGMVRNHPHINTYQIYKNDSYNRYVYIGKTRIDREEMTEEEERIMKAFDILCFKGNRHMKRGHGLKCYPIEMLYNCSKELDLVDYITNMFKTRIVKK